MINFRYQDYLVKFRNLSFLEHQVEEYSKQEQEKLEVRLKLIILHGHDRLKFREISVLNWIQDPLPPSENNSTGNDLLLQPISLRIEILH